jgi:raffinose/stachyose/melibiose transport system permease protein
MSAITETRAKADQGTPRRQLTRRRGATGPARGRRRPSWTWIIPGLVVAVAIQYVPVIAGAYYSLTNWTGIGAAEFVGLKNFTTIFSDPAARGALEHTLELSAAFVPIVNVLGFALAIGLNRTLRSRNLLRAMFFAPVVLTPLATSYIWAYIFQYSGPLNQVLAGLGLRSLEQTWLASPTWALWTILVVLVWQDTGMAMVIYLAGLQGIPRELEDAAAVDGASAWHRVRKVTLPQLGPVVTVNLTLSVIYVLRVFDQILALTDGGPYGASDTLASEVWKQTFVNDNYGYGAALALILTLLVAVVIGVLQLAARLRRRGAQ